MLRQNRFRSALPRRLAVRASAQASPFLLSFYCTSPLSDEARIRVRQSLMSFFFLQVLTL